MNGWLAGRGALILGGGPAAHAVARAFDAAGATVVHGEAHAAFGRGCTAETLAVFLDGFQAQSVVPFSILVLGATPEERQSSEAIPFDVWRDTLASDLDMRFFASAEFGRRGIASGMPGAILHLLKREAPAGDAGSSALAAAVAGVETMVKTLATEWARDGIRSNAIVSRIVQGGTDGELRALARLALYLCSDYAAYVTGCLMGVSEI